MLRLACFLCLGLTLGAQAKYVSLSRNEPSCPLADLSAADVSPNRRTNTMSAVRPSTMGSERGIDRNVLTSNGFVVTLAEDLGKVLKTESGKILIKNGGFYDFPRELRPDASAMVFYDGDHKPHRLLDQRGKVLVVGYFSLACDPSLNLLTELASLQGKQNKFGFTVFPVHATTERNTQFQQFVNRQRIEKDPTAFFSAGKGAEGFLFLTNELPALPCTFLIDRNGRLARFYVGYQAKDLEKGLTQLLGEKADQPVAPTTAAAN